MKYFIASDIHGSAYYCRRLLEAYQREGADRFVLLGDILYHGPRNDLPKDYNPKEVFAMLNGIKDSILSVRGNCDSEVDQMVLEFPIMAPYAILTQGNLVVYATHGDHYNTHRLPPIQKGTSSSMATPTCRCGNLLDRIITTSIPVQRRSRKMAIPTVISSGKIRPLLGRIWTAKLSTN